LRHFLQYCDKQLPADAPAGGLKLRPIGSANSLEIANVWWVNRSNHGSFPSVKSHAAGV